MADVVSLAVNGEKFEGWKEVQITKSLKAIAAGFRLSITDAFTKQGKPWVIRPGQACVLKIDGETVCAGYVDALNLSLGASERTISVDGRERTADLVDSCTEETQFVNFTLEKLAKTLGAPFKIDVLNEAKLAKSYPSISVNPGQTCFSILDQYAKRDGVLLTSTGKGSLVIAKLGGSAPVGVLEEGRNILSASASFDNKGRFRDYKVRSQNNYEAFDDDLAQSIEAEGAAQDTGVDRPRLLIVQAETGAGHDEAEQRARWEMVTRQAKAATVTVRVQGWRRLDGKLWAPNQLVKVKAPSIAVDATLLVSDVTFSQSIGQGTVTELQLTRKDAFQPAPSKPDEGELYKKLVRAGT